MHSEIATAFLLGMLVLSPVLARAEGDSRSLDQILLELSHTPADHSALANYYRAKASEARATAARHESMGRAYGRGKLGTGGASIHCEKLSEQNSAMASEFEELAKLHDAAAREAR